MPPFLRILSATLLTAVIACAAPPAAFSSDLDYVEITTAEAGETARLPMIVAVHGLGDSPEGFKLLFSRLEVPARIIVPRGTKQYGDNGYTWFPMRSAANGDEDYAAGIQKAAGQLAALIEKLSLRRPTVGKPTITGFSQGGVLSFAVAVLHPESVGMAVPISGYLPPELWPEPKGLVKKPDPDLPRVFALHGEKDLVIPVEQASWTMTVLEGQGYEADLRRYPETGHTVTADMRHDLIQTLAGTVEAAVEADEAANTRIPGGVPDLSLVPKTGAEDDPVVPKAAEQALPAVPKEEAPPAPSAPASPSAP